MVSKQEVRRIPDVSVYASRICEAFEQSSLYAERGIPGFCR